MRFTVQEVLALKPLEGARVIAGRAGLGNNVEHVTVFDAPDAVNWLRGGELVVTTAYMVKDDPAAQLAFVRSLAGKRASALGIKLRRFIDSLPDEVIAFADEAALPILEIPYEAAWIDIINPVMTEVLERQASVLKRSLEIHTQYIDTVLRGGDLTAVARVLAGQIGTPVAIVDMDWKLLAEAQGESAGMTDRPWSETLEWIRRAPEPERLAVGVGESENVSRVYCETPEKERLAAIMATVRIDAARYGRILALEPPDRPMGQMDVIAFEHAATTTALEILKARAASEVERRFRFNFWNDLMHAKFGTKDIMIQRAKALGWDFSVPHFLLVISLDNGQKLRDAEGKTTAGDRIRDRAQKTIESYSQASRLSLVCFDYRSSIVVLAPLKAPVDSRTVKELGIKTAENLKAAINGDISPNTVSVGVGRFYPEMLEIARTYREAKECLALGRNVFGEDSIIHFDDLGVYRILSKCVNQDEMRSFMDQQIGEIERYDAHHGTNLLESLERFFAAGGNTKDASDAMFVHVNTLKYRLKRIEDLLGADLDNPELRFNLQLAFRIRSFLTSED